MFIASFNAQDPNSTSLKLRSKNTLLLTYYYNFLNFRVGRHCFFDSSAPSILWLQVRVTNTPFTFFFTIELIHCHLLLKTKEGGHNWINLVIFHTSRYKTTIYAVSSGYGRRGCGFESQLWILSNAILSHITFIALDRINFSQFVWPTLNCTYLLA